MTYNQRVEITRIAKEFAEEFEGTVGEINGSGFLIVDPLSAYLRVVGYENTLEHIPQTDLHPQVLVMKFPDGTQFIPAGGDLRVIDPAFENWMWL